MRKRINHYNQPGNVLVITNYPPRGRGAHAAKIGGVAGFAKNSLVPLAARLDREDRNIIVLADTDGATRTYEEDGMLILRSWRRNSLGLYPSLWKTIQQFDSVSDILIQFEFASFGDFWITAAMPFFIALLKLSGKRVTIVLHQVVTSLTSLVGHIGLGGDSLGMRVFSFLLPVYYFLLTHLTDQTVVLEEAFRERLRGIAPLDRVVVIPHGVEAPERLPGKGASRNKLGLPPNEFILLSFGFITWYKGTDLLIKAIKSGMTVGGKPVRLIVAGGPSTTQQHKTHYQAYYRDVLALAHARPQVTITGFVPETKLGLYFAAADLVCFPYRTVMSSSGPLSLALSYGKPIALSPAVTAYLASPAVAILPMNLAKLPGYLSRIGAHRRLARLTRWSRSLSQKRSFPALADSYHAILTPQDARLPRLATA